MKKFITIVIVVLFIATNIFTAYVVRKACKPQVVEVHDTTLIVKPQVDTEYITKYVKVPVRVTDTIPGEPQLIVEHDTTYVVVPISSAYYHGDTKDGAYECWVSGYKPSLDSIRVVGNHTVVYETSYQYPKWDIQPTLNVGVCSRMVSAGAGIRVPYYNNHFIITPEVGYGVYVPFGGGVPFTGLYANFAVSYTFR